MIGTVILLTFLTLIFGITFKYALSNNTREAFGFCGIVLLLFVVIFAVGILGYSVTGNNMTIQRIKQAKMDIFATEKELKKTEARMIKMSEIFVKMIAVTNDGSGRWDGVPPEHREQLEIYKSELLKQLTYDEKKILDAEIEKMLQELNEKIRRRNDVK